MAKFLVYHNQFLENVSINVKNNSILVCPWTVDDTPIVEITGPALPQDAKDRLAKKITEVIAEEKKGLPAQKHGVTQKQLLFVFEKQLLAYVNRTPNV